MPVAVVPKGYNTVNVYLIVTGVARLIDFLKQAFGATEKERMARTDGTIMHAEMTIGDSVVMMGEPSAEFESRPTSLYIYVDDTDAAYRRGLQAGGESVREPADQFYGDRNAGVKDPSGNIWWIATHFEDISSEESEKRAKAQL